MNTDLFRLLFHCGVEERQAWDASHECADITSWWQSNTDLAAASQVAFHLNMDLAVQAHVHWVLELANDASLFSEAVQKGLAELRLGYPSETPTECDGQHIRVADANSMTILTLAASALVPAINSLTEEGDITQATKASSWFMQETLNDPARARQAALEFHTHMQRVLSSSAMEALTRLLRNTFRLVRAVPSFAPVWDLRQSQITEAAAYDCQLRLARMIAQTPVSEVGKILLVLGPKTQEFAGLQGPTRTRLLELYQSTFPTARIAQWAAQILAKPEETPDPKETPCLPPDSSPMEGPSSSRASLSRTSGTSPR